ncbi:hypothetical protein OG220_27485 [Streptomyces sp. NBC_01187]|nr:hypothetical protein OG220_27485 [Streptomyces sp. NBC_01187]
MTGTGGTVPGDEVHEGEGASADAAPSVRVRTGPRHAAPKKPLLTRLHVPAGKAIAIAAMPSAVLMGMGLTPQLANAKPLPKNPFKGDSCVSVADQKETEAEKEERKERAEKLKRDLARERAKREQAAKEKSGPERDKPAGDGAEEIPEAGSPKSPTPSGGSSGGSGSGDSTEKPPSKPPSSGSGSGSGSSGSSASEDEENPWYDPLGVGKTLDGVLKPKEPKEPEAPESPETEKPDTPSGGEKSSPKPTPSAPETPEKDAKPDTSGPGKPAAGKKAEKPGEADEGDKPEAKGKAKKDKDSKESGSGDGVSKKDGTARDYDAAKDGGKPFPCPEKMDVKGTDEQTPAQVPNQPWYLKASSLTLKGLDYEGVVNITMPNGKTKQALKFTSDALDIGDLHQTVKGPGGRTYHVQGAEGSTSTIRGGKVTMYTEELKGNLFGLIPITFSPESPPPINVPFAYFTKVTVKQAGQFGGNLTIPGLHQHITK